MKILKASAGSGKTFNLSKTYLELLLGSQDPRQYRHVLAVTFTNKATGERKSRILSHLLRINLVIGIKTQNVDMPAGFRHQIVMRLILRWIFKCEKRLQIRKSSLKNRIMIGRNPGKRNIPSQTLVAVSRQKLADHPFRQCLQTRILLAQKIVPEIRKHEIEADHRRKDEQQSIP